MPSAPQPILIDRLESQWIQRYLRNGLSLLVFRQHAHLTRHLEPPPGVEPAYYHVLAVNCTTLRNSATGRHLLLTARRPHRQVIGSDVDTDGHKHGDKAEPEAPIMMRTPPVRSLAVAMITLAHRMRVFGVVHHVVSRRHVQSCDGTLCYKRKSWAAVLPDVHAPT